MTLQEPNLHTALDALRREEEQLSERLKKVRAAIDGLADLVVADQQHLEARGLLQFKEHEIPVCE